ncbi:hypothetical protein NK553_10560 [Pseudomonas sp. ZM23]|uniref:Uncharacterized protein n=1 Tax=Pseudomonas triclosanedens TaxID=2961893 RepID=A0ABY7A279_9PSED|nr:hypothetical protein [Pseudomonas triclosanedens]MCP8464391.1 hypothetical protein [Pseudomonas triclosanedens]MCP8471525.1 hypothetical protein [Pseudomonas triclosanedens]MCP8477666.1 hypothetical protein [Pseudomonas triclosanedens]WAI51121.1 hypothetical protein OU419_07660 [Pseudomonas triclosanedens]
MTKTPGELDVGVRAGEFLAEREYSAGEAGKKKGTQGVPENDHGVSRQF